ncbi:MAG: 30S ribosomal protein S3 [Candidatus Levybacteria bacterium]|nr:30S ribosomal protein S3 [Candidatus Levybacteria bacterium]
MGQKVNAHLIRVGPVFGWESRWFGGKTYKDTLLSDFKIRKALMEKLRFAGVARIEIDRSINSLKIIAFVSKPGMVIGRSGAGLDELKKYVQTLMLTIIKDKKQMPKTDIVVEPIKEPNLDAYLVAKNVSDQLIKRLPAKRVLGQASERVMGAGAKGVRIILSGRIGGAEIGRREKIQKGTVPLSTIRANINYASAPSLTKKGYIGVKVWIHKEDEK